MTAQVNGPKTVIVVNIKIWPIPLVILNAIRFNIISGWRDTNPRASIPSPLAISAAWKKRNGQWITPGNEDYHII